MMPTGQPRLRSNVLVSKEPNLQLCMDRDREANSNGKPSTASPLKKQSDYKLVAPLASNPTRQGLVPRSNPRSAAPKTPLAKPRKKLLCATPPQVLQDLKGQRTYDRGRQIGEGGFARCFLVQNKERVLFAAKTVAKSSLESAKTKSKFFGELAVHKTMKHPNIVRFVEVFEDCENIYMILELCANKSLMDMLRRRKRFTEPETRYFILQLMGSLKYMHSKRVIHRDLKLGNIFLDENMNIKIGDFGLAALLVDENERKKTMCGTPNYIAPEVLFNGGKDGDGHSFEVDLWAVGVILYAMLVGKPPFQSSDVDSIYKKIRHNSFNWPDTISVSQSAKSLVNALLNSDPAARPSLDEIANHEFFKSGYFPKSIPVSATTLEPEWPTTGQDFSTLAACCQEWRRNYDSVAKAAGVGIDSTGTPVRPVGDGAGKPLEPVPFSRPASAASSTDTEPVESYKPLGKRRENKLKGPAKPNSGYILPEALSPRDGHARMRNMGILRGIPSRLGLKPPISRTELNPSSSNVIPEETEPEDSEKDSVARPIRHLEKKPIRKTSRIQEPEAPDPVPALVLARAPVAPKETVKPVGRLQKPNGSEEAEPPVVKTEIQTRRVTSELPLRAASIRRPEVPETQTTISAEGQAPVRTLREKSPEHLSPNPIPFGSNLSSRVGKAIPETSTGAILTSFQPVVANLTAFTCSNIEALSPPPPATVEAVRAFRAGEDNRAVFVKKWVDYTNKYGLAYMLSDGTAATLYNDNTSFVVDALGGNVVEWITHSLSEPAQTVRGRPESVFRRLTTEMAVIKQKSKSSEGLRSKLAIWRRTTNYMNQCLGVGESWDFERKEVVREPTFGQHADTEHMLWISHYARLRRCVVFRLIDGTIQLNFVDHTKLILTSAGRTLRLVANERLYVMSLEGAFEACKRGDKLVIEFGLKQKMMYVKEILRAWCKTGRFPGHIDSENGEPIVILGEGPEA